MNETPFGVFQEKSMKKWSALFFLILLFPACSAMNSPVSLDAEEIGRSKRFVAYENGTVKDMTSGLMWAAKDNGGPISWSEAKRYCRNYRGGGHRDWRMPTTEELTGIYNPEIKNDYPLSEGCNGVCRLTQFIHLTCCAVWSWDGITEVETFFHFDRGPGDWRDQSLAENHPRTLPVRDDP